MALSANLWWRVCKTGAQTNSGGFDKSLTAGMLTDGSITSGTTASPVLHSASTAFTSAEVGAHAYLSNAPVPGWYPIVSVSGGDATLDAAITANGSGAQRDDFDRTPLAAIGVGGASPSSITFAVDYSPLATGISVPVLASTASTALVSAGTEFKAFMVGNIIRIASGTGLTAGTEYRAIVTYTNSAHVVVDAATGTYVNGVARIGGAFSTLVNLVDSGGDSAPTPTLANPWKPGQSILLQGAGTDNPAVGSPDYTTTGYWNIAAGDGTAGGCGRILGYTGKPLILGNGLLFNQPEMWRMDNIKMAPSDVNRNHFFSGFADGVYHKFSLALNDCYWDQNGKDLAWGDGIFLAFQCQAFNTSTATAGTYYTLHFNSGGVGAIACRIQSQRGLPIGLGSCASAIMNLVTDNVSGAIARDFDNSAHLPDPFGCLSLWNTIDNSTGDSDTYLYNDNLLKSTSWGNLITRASAYGISSPNVTAPNQMQTSPCDYNAFYSSGTANYHYLTAGTHDVAVLVSPYLTSTNYGLNTSATGGMLCKDTGYPGVFPGGTSTGYADIGAIASTEAATAITLTGPSSGNYKVASTNFTVGADGAITGTVVVTPTDSSGAGTFTPSTVSLTSGSPTGTFTYTPTTAGARNINCTNNGSLSAPSNIAYTSNAVAPYTPSAPTASAGNAQATVTLTAPDNGGSAITGYTVTSSPAGGTDSNAGQTTLSHVITGLTNGTPYTFTFTATNAIGTSSASPASNSVTPTAAPATALTLSGPSSGSRDAASTNFTVGANGSLTGTHVVTPNSTLGGSFSPTTVSISSGSSTGTFTYTPSAVGVASVSASDSLGLNGPTPVSYTVNPIVPKAPTAVTGSPFSGRITVTGIAPNDNGGASITGYIADDGSTHATASGALPRNVTGLTNGVAYTVRLSAVNSVGQGAWGTAAAAVTPHESFSIVPNATNVIGVVTVTATGDGTNWSTNPFTVTSGPGTIGNYTNISPTSATFDLTVSALTGNIVIADSDSGTSDIFVAGGFIGNIGMFVVGPLNG